MSQVTTRINATKLQGVPIDPTTPTDGQILIFNSLTGQWEPHNPPFTTTITISALTANGVWYPSNFVGPTCASESSAYVSAFNGVGAARIPRAGILKNFKYTNAYPPGSDIPVDLYQAPGGNPAFLSFTGISMTMPTGAYITQNITDELIVAENDIVIFYNSSLFIGYTPSAMTITGDLVSP